ncbi:DUF418 domain-containing protein [Sphingobium sp. DC-2]|uniref:DUF418 domain-containing protein n=1 Tax=Sphingobium sp. DC-2 TaxID=1303256 RepID=UPI0004C324C3|nr:DUF418 domain-containing protein [Sphingobium sp. DC-2]
MSAPSFRIPAMDVLRGCAVMGILWMNITAFAFPQAAYFNPRVTGPLSAGDTLFWLVSFLLFDGKMRALFSMLFGASMLLLVDREELAGRNGRRAQMIRAAWLFLIGLAHYLLLWWGDILTIYALVGIAALPFIGKEPLSLVKWAFLFFLAHFLVCTLFVLGLYGWAGSAVEPGAASAARDGFAAFAASFTDPNHSAIQSEILTYRSGFGTILRHHLHLFANEWPNSLLFTGLDTLGFMLLGMAMLKGGFLTGRWDAGQYRRTAVHCFLIGLPPMAGLAAWLITGGFPVLPAFGAALAWSFPFRIPLSVGWAALILWLIVRHQDSALVQRIAAAGRLALSNYLGTSLAMCALFYGWGLGLFAQLRPAQLPLVVLCVWAVILLWSKPWLSRFAMGPAEWLWRSLAHGKPQKIRKSS